MVFGGWQSSPISALACYTPASDSRSYNGRRSRAGNIVISTPRQPTVHQ